MWYNASWNAEIIKLIQSIHTPFLDNLFQGFTMLGEEYFYIFALTLIYWCIDKNFGYRIGFAFLSGMTLNSGIKESLMIPRPIGEPGIRSLRIETATGWSFPSGHAQGVSTFWTSLMTVFKGKSLRIVGIIFIMLVGISRMYLGVHRPIDVIAAIVIAVLWVIIVNLAFDYVENGGSRIVFVLFLIPAIIGLVLLKNEDYYKAAGTFLGFMLGYMIEPQYIDFEERGSLGQNVLKFIIGISGVLIIKSGLKLLLPELLISDLIRYFMIGAWVTLGATAIFKGFIKTERYIFR